MATQTKKPQQQITAAIKAGVERWWKGAPFGAVKKSLHIAHFRPVICAALKYPSWVAAKAARATALEAAKKAAKKERAA